MCLSKTDYLWADNNGKFVATKKQALVPRLEAVKPALTFKVYSTAKNGASGATHLPGKGPGNKSQMLEKKRNRVEAKVSSNLAAKKQATESLAADGLYCCSAIGRGGV